MNETIISQSLVKALDPNAGNCAAKTYAIYFLGMKQEPSRSMNLGNYFETVVYGSTEEGEQIKAELNKRTGEPLVEYQRVMSHAVKFLSEYKMEYKMDLAMPRVHLHTKIPGYDSYVIRCRIDLMTSLYDPEKFRTISRVIMDTKITSSVDSTFGPFSWGTPEAMDHLQMDVYSWVAAENYETQPPAYYFIMEHGPMQRKKLLEKVVTKENIERARKRVIMCIHTIEDLYARYGTDWPRTPDPKNCKGCPLRSSCPSAMLPPSP